MALFGDLLDIPSPFYTAAFMMSAGGFSCMYKLFCYNQLVGLDYLPG